MMTEEEKREFLVSGLSLVYGVLLVGVMIGLFLYNGIPIPGWIAIGSVWLLVYAFMKTIPTSISRWRDIKNREEK